MLIFVGKLSNQLTFFFFFQESDSDSDEPEEMERKLREKALRSLKRASAKSPRSDDSESE